MPDLNPPPAPDVLRHLRAAFAGMATVPDADLLDRFARSRDEAAFELLVWRHGRLVWGVCRRVARDRGAAEDAFQATFLALARHAGAVADRAAVGGWLYRAALAAARRRPVEPLGELEVADPAPPPPDAAASRELLRLIDAEVAGLPDRFRDAFVLCELQGRSNAEAAADLGVPVGTVESRLSRARSRLRARLTARGVMLGGLAGLTAGVVPTPIAGAAVQAGLGAGVRAGVLAIAAAACQPTRWGPACGALATLTAVAAAIGLAAATPPLPDPPARSVPVPADADSLPPGAVARLGSTRFRGPPYQIEAAAVSPDGRSVAVGDYGESVRVFDTATGTARLTIPIQAQKLGWGRLVPRFTAAGGLTVLCRNYTDDTALSVRRFGADGRPSDEVRCPPPKGFGPGGWYSLSGDAGRATALWSMVDGRQTRAVLRVYDTATGRVTCEVPLGSPEKEWHPAPALSRDGRRAAVVVGTVGRVIDTDTGAELDRWEVRSKWDTAVGISPDGDRVAVGVDTNEDVRTLVRDVSAGATVTLTEPGQQVIGYSFDRSGRVLATHDHHGVTVWDLERKAVRHRLARGTEVSVAEFAPDGRWLMTAGHAGAVTLWDLRTGNRLPASADPPTRVAALRFLDGGTRVAADAGGWVTWDRSTGRPGRPLGRPPEWSFQPTDLYPDGRVVVTLDHDRLIVSDGRTGRPRWEQETPGGAAVRYSADGRRLVAKGHSWITSWDAATGQEVHTVRDAKPGDYLLALSPDGGRALLATPATFGAPNPGHAALDLATGERLWADDDPKADGWFGAAASPDGKLVAYNRPRRDGLGSPSAGGGGLVVREFATGRLVARIDEQEAPGATLAFSPDGRLLAEGTDAGAVRVRDAGTGKVLRTFRHRSAIWAVAFSPDGSVLAAASDDAPVFLWDVSGIRK